MTKPCEAGRTRLLPVVVSRHAITAINSTTLRGEIVRDCSLRHAVYLKNGSQKGLFWRIIPRILHGAMGCP